MKETYKSYLKEISAFIPRERIYTDEMPAWRGAPMPASTALCRRLWCARRRRRRCRVCFRQPAAVDLAARVIHRGEEEVHLTPIEFRLLAVLLNNAGKVLTQRQLLNQVWGPNAVEHSHYLRIYMGHLRQKLEQDPARPRHFITETGIGYRFML